MAEQERMLGLDPERVREANDVEVVDQVDETYELPPQLWPAWQCFLSTWNQWRVITGFAAVHYEGIDQGALHSAMQMLGIKRRKWPQVFAQVLTLEDEARKLRNTK